MERIRKVSLGSGLDCVLHSLSLSLSMKDTILVELETAVRRFQFYDETVSNSADNPLSIISISVFALVWSGVGGFLLESESESESKLVHPPESESESESKIVIPPESESESESKIFIPPESESESESEIFLYFFDSFEDENSEIDVTMKI